MKILRTASLGSNFTGSHKKECRLNHSQLKSFVDLLNFTKVRKFK